MRIIPFKWCVSETFLGFSSWTVIFDESYSLHYIIMNFRHRFPFEIWFRNSHDVESSSFDRRRNIAPDDDWKTPGSNSLEITSDSVLIRSWNWPGCFSLKKLTFNILEFCTNRFWRTYFYDDSILNSNKHFLFGVALIMSKPVQFREKVSRYKFNHSHRWQA